MAYINAVFKISKTSSTNIFVEEVKLNGKYCQSFLFDVNDRPIKFHPIILDHLNNLKRSLKSSDNVTIELSNSNIKDYYDISTNKFWFNKAYLLPVDKSEELDEYNSSIDPNQYVINFNKKNSKMSDIDKLNLFLKFCPEDTVDLIRLEARYVLQYYLYISLVYFFFPLFFKEMDLKRSLIGSLNCTCQCILKVRKTNGWIQIPLLYIRMSLIN